MRATDRGAESAGAFGGVRYHLRVSLTERHRPQEVRALWGVIRRAGIDEVLFFVPHAEERSTGLGARAEHARVARGLEPLFRRLRGAGVAPSINVWWTVSFSEFPGLRRDLRDRFAFRWAVSVDGRTSVSVACPACPAWRAEIATLYRTYAALKPVRIWIDDDVRMTLRADLHSPCFCDGCLKEMARRTGRSLSRPDWLRAIMADPPNPVREAWLAYQRELALEIVGGIAREVHAVSPESRVCLMHSCPEMHSAEGRRWAELVGVLGGPTPTLRPGIGGYNETTGLGFAAAFNNARLTQAVVPPGTALAPEIETYPQSRFGKSVASVAADLLLAQVIGMREATFSIYRFSGRLDLETRREDVWSEVLRGLKPRLQAIADLGVAPEQQRGVSLYWHEDAARHARAVGAEPKPIFLYRQRPWDQVLPAFGLAVRYGLGSRVTALAGEQIECLSGADLERVFAGGVLLDARAADSLLRTGRGELAGVADRKPDANASFETIEDRRFGGLAGDPINCRWTSTAWQFGWRRGARMVSVLRGYSGEARGHGVVVFENRLGGRVVCCPFDSQGPGTTSLGIAHPALESPSFLCRSRQAQLRDALTWAGRLPLPLCVEGAPMVYPLLVEQEGRLIVAAVNLMPDPVRPLVLTLCMPGLRLRRVRALTAEGDWHVCRSATMSRSRRGPIRISTGVALGYLDVAVLVLE